MKQYRIDKAQKIVHVRYSDVITDIDLQSGLHDYTAVGSDFIFLIDLTEVVNFRVTSEAVKLAAQAWGSEPRLRVVIAPTPATFGFARLYATVSERPDIEIFRDSESAWKRIHQQKETGKSAPI